MEIDLNQLPIPDWGAHCPVCRYALVGLPGHRCPECGADLDMSEIVQTWHRLRPPRRTGDERPIPAWGIQCRNCRRLLDGSDSLKCPGCGAATDGAHLRPPGEWFVVDETLAGDVPLPTVEILLAGRYVPYVRRSDKLLREIYFGPRMIGSRLLVPTEFYFDVIGILRGAAADMRAARVCENQNPWTCDSCGEEVPAHFDVCWNCQRERT